MASKPRGEQAPGIEPVVVQSSEPEPAVALRRRFKESEPLAEKDWAPDPGARPYSEAVTDEQRTHLKEFGLEPPKRSKE